MSLSETSSGSNPGSDQAMDCTEEPDTLGHPIDCQKNCCKDKTRIDRWETVLKSYEELTKPSNMAKPKPKPKAKDMSDDPLNHAFKLTREIKKLKKTNREVRSELKDFSRKSKKFTVDLLDTCENSKEVDVIFNSGQDDEQKKIEILTEAVAAKHKEFVAHRHAQQLLRTIVYADFPTRNFVQGLFGYASYTITFPIWACIFILKPQTFHNEWYYMGKPFGKFVSHASQYCVFVTLLALSSLRNSTEPRAIEYLILTFVLAMAIEQTRKIVRKRFSYFYKWWNCVLAAMLMSFVTSAFLMLIGSRLIGGWSTAQLVSKCDIAGHNILLLANSLFSISSVISVFYLGSLCQVNSTFGPLQLSTLRMMKDIGKFLTIFLGLFFAFTLGVRNLYSYNKSLEIEYFHSNANSTAHELAKFSKAWQLMFWALFDQADMENFGKTHPRYKITSETGKFLFAIYLIFAVVVGINMLIAMMNNSFEYVAEDKRCLNWKMSRTAMWLEFTDKADFWLPPPYNILHYLIYFVMHIKCKAMSKENSMDPAEDAEMNPTDVQNNKPDGPNRNSILKEIVERYLENNKESE